MLETSACETCGGEIVAMGEYGPVCENGHDGMPPFVEGDRVRFRTPWHVCVDFELVIDAGTTGTVALVQNDLVSVRIDEPEELLEAWDNEVHILADGDPTCEFHPEHYLELEDDAQRRVNAASEHAGELGPGAV